MHKHYSLNYWKKLIKTAYQVYVNAEELGRNREADLNHITHELNIIQEYAVGFQVALQLIYDGTAERILIEEENDW